MSCCIKKILKRCTKVAVMTNTLLQLPYTGLADGDYTAVLSFLGKDINIPVTAQDGTVKIPVYSLNENFYYEGQLFDNAGSLITNADGYDGFAFTTIFISYLAEAPAPITTETDPIYNADKPLIVVQNKFNSW